MSWINHGTPALFAVKGADAIRYINGQVTQDVRRVMGDNLALSGCVLDVKGRVQFRVWMMKGPDDSLWIQGEADLADELEARLEKYLIADDAEIERIEGWRLWHGIEEDEIPEQAVVFRAERWGVAGQDVWLPDNDSFAPDLLLEGEKLEDFRIRNRVPIWGAELVPGIFPQEAGLEDSDISFHKGCYIGQEVISRIKRAGKINRHLVSITVVDDVRAGDNLLQPDGSIAGQVSSVSPFSENGRRHALAYVKRGAEVAG
ncbi:MAG: hypothetical protein V4733_08390 [Verrucomicrobiota bacterium]